MANKLYSIFWSQNGNGKCAVAEIDPDTNYNVLEDFYGKLLSEEKSVAADVLDCKDDEQAMEIAAQGSGNYKPKMVEWKPFDYETLKKVLGKAGIIEEGDTTTEDVVKVGGDTWVRYHIASKGGLNSDEIIDTYWVTKMEDKTHIKTISDFNNKGIKAVLEDNRSAHVSHIGEFSDTPDFYEALKTWMGSTRNVAIAGKTFGREKKTLHESTLREREKWYDGGYDPSKLHTGENKTVDDTISAVYNMSSGGLATYAGTDKYKEIGEYREAVLQWIHENDIIGDIYRVLVRYNKKYNKAGKQYVDFDIDDPVHKARSLHEAKEEKKPAEKEEVETFENLIGRTFAFAKKYLEARDLVLSYFNGQTREACFYGLDDTKNSEVGLSVTFDMKSESAKSEDKAGKILTVKAKKNK